MSSRIKLLTAKQVAETLGYKDAAYFIKKIACQKGFPKPVKIRLANEKLSSLRWHEKMVNDWIIENTVTEE